MESMLFDLDLVSPPPSHLSYNHRHYSQHFTSYSWCHLLHKSHYLPSNHQASQFYKCPISSQNNLLTTVTDPSLAGAQVICAGG